MPPAPAPPAHPPPDPPLSPWLTRYATSHHAWQRSATPAHPSCTTFSRALGLVELSFALDGAHSGGRADMTGTLHCRVRSRLGRGDVRRRIEMAWACLRARHVLLMGRRGREGEGGGGGGREEEEIWGERIAIDVPPSVDDAVRSARDTLVWVGDSYAAGEVDVSEFHEHALNVARLVRPEECLARLYVLPTAGAAEAEAEAEAEAPAEAQKKKEQKEEEEEESWPMHFLLIFAHQISDGLSAYAWLKDLLHILNQPAPTILSTLSASIDPAAVRARLPPAQEALYPAVRGSRARQRWVWALVRVLRHVRRAAPRTFANPLYRVERRGEPVRLQPKYAKVFEYGGEGVPALTTGHVGAVLSPKASERLLALCRENRLSVGAGCFALAGLAMMDLYGARYGVASCSETHMPAMTASFPLNPRAFFTPPPPADSCMLAFAEGIVLPFLPASLPAARRFRLAAATANRELRVYQKRRGAAGAAGGLDRYAPGRLLATGYLSQIERVEAKLPAGRTLGLGNPQGELAASGGFAATCGVSSVGSLKDYFRPGEYDLTDETKDFIVDYRGLRMGVRAREGEFLVGSSTDAEGRVGFGVSYDMNAIDRESAELWARTITGLLETSDGSKL